MIHEHNGIAISLYSLKALRTELSGEGGFLIFEFDNALVRLENDETGKWVERSYRNEPLSQFYDDVLDLQESFDAWIGVWNNFVTQVSTSE